jgi:hypothetical protein
MNAAFTVENPAGHCEVGAAMHSAFVASDPATVGNRAYAGWTLDVMKAHGIKAEDVEYVIAHGQANDFDGKIGYLPPRDSEGKQSFRVIVDDTGKVLRVFY